MCRIDGIGWAGPTFNAKSHFQQDNNGGGNPEIDQAGKRELLIANMQGKKGAGFPLLFKPLHADNKQV